MLPVGTAGADSPKTSLPDRSSPSLFFVFLGFFFFFVPAWY